MQAVGRARHKAEGVAGRKHVILRAKAVDQAVGLVFGEALPPVVAVVVGETVHAEAVVRSRGGQFGLIVGRGRAGASCGSSAEENSPGSTITPPKPPSPSVGARSLSGREE